MPNRIIKESIHSSEDVNKMTDFQFRLWISLITYVDDFGRGDARPAIIKGSCFPLRDRITVTDIDAALRALAGIGCVGLYKVDGKPYLYFPTWESHQRIQTKKSRFPAPELADPPSSTVSHGESPLESKENTNPNPNPKENPNTKENAREARRSHGKYKWVKLTDEEFAALEAELGQAELARCIQYVDESAQGTHNRNGWRDWALTIRKCSRNRWGLPPLPSSRNRVVSRAEYEARPVEQIDMGELKDILEKI